MDLARQTYRTLRLFGAGMRFHLAPMIGAKTRYGIDAGYRHRSRIRYFDDTVNADHWQREVYERTRDFMRDKGLRTVHDIGCGSGYKLVHLLGEFETTGVDLPETIEKVRTNYPDRNWVAGDFEETKLDPADLVISSDVIEHVQDPDALMRFILRTTKEWVVLSTPARELIYTDRQRMRFGPPDNVTHMREWTMAEFRRYVEGYLEIVRHEITNREQGTQMIIGRKRG